MKSAHAFIVAAAATVCIAGCNYVDSPTVLPGAKSVLKVDFSVVTTVGNRTYIPLNKVGNPDEHARVILEILKKFEEEKHVKITDWKIEKIQSAQGSARHIYGLWVDHAPIQAEQNTNSKSILPTTR